MAIYHLSVKNISRGKGKSILSAAAYRAGEKLKEEKTGLTYNYIKKQDVIFSIIYTPDNVKDKLQNREFLWNEIDKIEKRKDARLAKEIEVALPNEFDIDTSIEIIENFLENNVINLGVIADVNIHDSVNDDGIRNLHAHILITMRQYDNEKGFGKKIRELDKRETIEKWRKGWEQALNIMLSEKQQVDCRSNKERGIERLPTIHEGYVARDMERKGKTSDRCETNRRIKKTNEKIETIEREVENIEKIKKLQRRKSDIKQRQETDTQNYTKDTRITKQDRAERQTNQGINRGFTETKRKTSGYRERIRYDNSREFKSTEYDEEDGMEI